MGPYLLLTTVMKGSMANHSLLGKANRKGRHDKHPTDTWECQIFIHPGTRWVYNSGWWQLKYVFMFTPIWLGKMNPI